MYGYGGVPGAPGNVGGVNLDSGVVSGHLQCPLEKVFPILWMLEPQTLVWVAAI